MIRFPAGFLCGASFWVLKLKLQKTWTCSFATLCSVLWGHIFHAFTTQLILTELWSCLSGQTLVKLRPRMKLASGCRPTQLYGRIGCPTRPNASRNLAFTIAPLRLGPWSWIFVMVLDYNFCQQKRARNLLFLRRCFKIYLTYIEEGVETLDLWGFEGYKWWNSQPFYFLWGGVETSHGLNPSFSFGWTSPIAPQNDPRLGQTKGDNSPRNLKHPAYFVT